jgi:hypothetical protein
MRYVPSSPANAHLVTLTLSNISESAVPGHLLPG